MQSSGRGAVSPFLIMEALREANRFATSSDKRVIHMSLGQPGREVPARVRDAVADRLRVAPLGYTEAGGMKLLRERISRHYAETYGVEVSPERIFVTLGSSSAFLMTLLSAFEKDDEIAIAVPCYPAYPNIMQAVNITPVYLRGEEASKFQPTVGMLEALTRKPKGLITASPSNPAGTMLDSAAIATLVDYCAAKRIRIIADEIYHGITYNGRADTVLAHTDQAIVLNSFSKYFMMPGWRVGWVVLPPQMAAGFESLASSMFISPSSVGQYAALEAFECKEDLDKAVAEYTENRAILLRELPTLGMRLAPVEGAFFVYANVSGLTNDSVAFCKAMLHETGVVTVPGLDFDRAEGNRYVRFSFSNSTADVIEAMQRLKAWVK
jgi:aspartate/methionine/tyrosine aminotransferase